MYKKEHFQHVRVRVSISVTISNHHYEEENHFFLRLLIRFSMADGCLVASLLAASPFFSRSTAALISLIRFLSKARSLWF